MNAWERYLALVREYPQVIQSPLDGPSIRVITDTQVMQAEQARLRAAGQEEAWTEFGVLAEDPWVYVVRDLVEFPDGRRNGYTRVINRKTLEGGTGGICVLPVWNGRIVLLKHFRHAPRQYVWEIPRGFGERGLSPEENVRRELREEVGANVLRLVPMGVWLPDTAILSGHANVFYAEIDEPVPNEADAAADGIVAQRLVTPAELDRMIISGEVVELFTIASLGMARARGLLESGA